MIRFMRPILVLIAGAVIFAGSSSAAESKTGTVSGVIRLEGDVPEIPPLMRKGTELQLGEIIPEDIPDRSLVVDDEIRGIANVFVYLAERPAGVAAETDPQPSVLKTRNFEYVPRAAVLRTGGAVRVENKDRRIYNVHTRPQRSMAFNYVVGDSGEVTRVLYERPEPFPLAVRCDFYPWMLGWHLPLDHPFAAVTDEQGRFVIEGLPPGKHKLMIWHERSGYLAKSLLVEVREGETARIDQQFPAEEFEMAPPSR